MRGRSSTSDRDPEGGAYGGFWAWGDKSTPRYPPEEEVEGLVPVSERVLATGPAGSIVICDVSGLHRGGYGRSKVRVLSTQTYVARDLKPDQPKKARRLKVEWGGAAADQARFALS